MYDLFFSDHAAVFTVPAIVGTVFFIIRLTMMLTLGMGDLGIDGDHHGDSSEAFKVLSIQAIAAFFMGFGWGGLGSLKGSGWDWPTSVAVAIAGGAAMVWLLGILLKAVHDLQTSGNISMEDAIGCEGTVYATIPAAGHGAGQVRVVVDQRDRIYNAITEGESLPSNTLVRIVNVNSDHTLTVTKT
jgi:hypothetical protein